MRLLLLSLLVVAWSTVSRAGEIDGKLRDDGLTVVLLPHSSTKLAPGFLVPYRKTPTPKPDDVFTEPEELADYAERLRTLGRMNGIWMWTGHDSQYSAADWKRVSTLVARCKEKNIPVYHQCLRRLSDGWTELK
jgi:hypothetical protein